MAKTLKTLNGTIRKDIRNPLLLKHAPCWNRTNNPVIRSVWLAPIPVIRYELL